MLEAEVAMDTSLTKKKVKRKYKKNRTSTPDNSRPLPNMEEGVVIPPISPKRYKVYMFDGTLRKKTSQLDVTDSSNSSKLSKLRQKRGPGSDGSSSFSSDKMSWVTYGSPLWHKDKVPTTIKPLPAISKQKQLEEGFVNDAVKTFMFHYSRKKPIIPPYNAVNDKYAQAYFQSPIAKAVLDRSMQRAMQVKLRDRSFNFEDAEIQRMNKINKLSFRRRAKESPTAEEIRAREMQFRNDAIITEKLRTKYKDIIPRYDASSDNHCKGYFNRPDVQRLVSVTCGSRK